MKPRTEKEKAAARINAILKEDISASDKNFAIQKLKNEVINAFVYFTITEKKKEFNIARLYRVYEYRGIYLFVEIVRKIGDYYFAKMRECYNSYTCYDTFSFSSDIELKENSSSKYGYHIGDLFDLSYFIRERHGGKRIKCVKMKPQKLARIISIPYGETLYNRGEDDIIRKLIYYPYTKEFLSSIRIAKKHGFVFTEENIYEWFDMVYSIIRTKNDNHNPKFVAPADLNSTHNFFIKKLEKKIEKDRRHREELAQIREEKKELAKLEKEKKENRSYVRRRKCFFNLIISDKSFDIHVLRDVAEFFEEGKEMCHCVFSCGYYKKEDSLILSCRDKSGNRVETIEVDLQTFKVTQCYGKYDRFTKYHKQILQLMKKQMYKIRQCERPELKQAV
jgi:hypothetical protein